MVSNHQFVMFKERVEDFILQNKIVFNLAAARIMDCIQESDNGVVILSGSQLIRLLKQKVMTDKCVSSFMYFCFNNYGLTLARYKPAIGHVKYIATLIRPNVLIDKSLGINEDGD